MIGTGHVRSSFAVPARRAGGSWCGRRAGPRGALSGNRANPARSLFPPARAGCPGNGVRPRTCRTRSACSGCLNWRTPGALRPAIRRISGADAADSSAGGLAGLLAPEVVSDLPAGHVALADDAPVALADDAPAEDKAGLHLIRIRLAAWGTAALTGAASSKTPVAEGTVPSTRQGTPPPPLPPPRSSPRPSARPARRSRPQGRRLPSR